MCRKVHFEKVWLIQYSLDCTIKSKIDQFDPEWTKKTWFRKRKSDKLVFANEPLQSVGV